MRLKFFVAAALAAGLGVTLAAQKTTQIKVGGGGSPHVRSEWTIDGASIVVEYGRPSLKGRHEGMMMPGGQPWRTGADEATIITSDKALKFGSITLPAGTHTINTVPGDKQWQLLLGRRKQPGQWGIPYDKSLEVGAVPMTIGKPAAAVETLTISVDDTPAGATLRIEWGSKSATAPFTIG